MLAKFRGHLRSHVVAYVALFFALSGTAIAAKPLVTGEDIADDSVTGADVLESSLGPVPSAQRAPLSGVVHVSRVFSSTSAEHSGHISCPEPKIPVGGRFKSYIDNTVSGEAHKTPVEVFNEGEFYSGKPEAVNHGYIADLKFLEPLDEAGEVYKVEMHAICAD